MNRASLPDLFLDCALHRFRELKRLGERAIAQLEDADLDWSPEPDSNSIAIILQHLAGNMMSRWSDFLTQDGEKPWRDRDREFLSDSSLGREALLARWEEGWRRLEAALRELKPEDLKRQVRIRGESLSVVDAILRQLAHYANHVGQVVYIAKQRRGDRWQTLSIARGGSQSYRPQPRD